MGAVKSKSQALKDKKNPCRGLKDKQCFWSVGKNINFEDSVVFSKSLKQGYVSGNAKDSSLKSVYQHM
jgi:hypothetical protein